MDDHSHSRVLPAAAVRRRTFLAGAGVAAAGVMTLLMQRHAKAATDASAGHVPTLVTIVPFTDAGVRGAPTQVPKVIKTDAAWKASLPEASYKVAREEGTELAFSGPYNTLHAKGIFHCICCGTPAYSSDTKFESGTGWPSFYQPIAKENITETSDRTFGMVRTAVSCTRCDAHLGHVFDDGPRPTGLRYCMNSVALKFVPLA